MHIFQRASSIRGLTAKILKLPKSQEDGQINTLNIGHGSPQHNNLSLGLDYSCLFRPSPIEYCDYTVLSAIFRSEMVTQQGWYY